MWWHLFVSNWNGVSLLWNSRRATPEVEVWSDASGGWGCGAIAGQHWLQHQWLPGALDKSIAVKELVPIVMVATIWGAEWQGKVVLFHCDNQSVVAILNNLDSREEDLMHLVRCLFFLAARHQFWFLATHVPGVTNKLADAISRNHMSQFFAQAPPGISRVPSPLQPSLPALLYLERPDWLSPRWTQLFHNSTEQR